VVRAGSGTGVVVATGGDAEFGRIAVGLGQQQPETEFQVGLRKFSMLLVQVAGALTGAIFIINVALHKPVIDALLFSLATRLPGHYVDLPDLPGQDPGLGLSGAVVPVQLIAADFGLFNAKANGGGVAFFAHVGGFVFGVLITRLLVRAGQITPQARYADSPL